MARLDSWKAIADYLGRDVRTVRRWEQDRRLPVHRVPGEHRGGVFAFTEEIDQWLRQSPGDGTAEAGAIAVPEPVVSQRRARPSAAWAVILLLLAGPVAWVWMRPGDADSPVVRVSVTQSGLVADGDRGQLWTWSIPVQQRAPSKFKAEVVDRGRAVMAGTIGDLATPVGSAVQGGGRLWRLSQLGAEVWMHTLDGHIERYRDREFVAPWVLRTWSTDSHSGLVAAAWSHEVWWPSLTQVVDRDRAVVATFRNPGWVTSVAWLDDTPGRLVVGGMSNPHDAAMAAVLDVSVPAAQAPPQEGEFSCDRCGEGRPLRYLVLPRSEVNRALMATVNQALVESRPDRITVRTVEVDRDPTYMGGEVVYEFDPEFQLRTVTYSDRYWQVHALLETEGRLDHARDACPDRDGPRGLREWTPAAGWRTLR